MRASTLVLFCSLLPLHLVAKEIDFADLFEKDPITTHNCTNVLRGVFSLNRTDFAVEAAEPIVFSRSYSTANTLLPKGGWSFFPHLHIKLNVKEDKFAIVGDPAGGEVKYKVVSGDRKHNPIYTFVPCVDGNSAGFCNSTQEEISARNNIRNNRLVYHLKEKTAYLTTADGTQRIYRVRGRIHSNGKSYCFLEKEVKPNGNILLYNYDEEDRLKSLSSHNPSQTKTYASLSFNYVGKKGKNKNFSLSTSDGRKADYRFCHYKPSYLHDFFYLKEVIGTGLPHETIDYELGYEHYHHSHGHPEKKKNRNKSRGPFLRSLFLEGQKVLGVEYYLPEENPLPETRETSFIESAQDLRCERVRALLSPIGEKGECLYSQRIHYGLSRPLDDGGFEGDGITRIHNLIDRETRYLYSGRLRMKRIEYYTTKKEEVSQRKTPKNFRFSHKENIRKKVAPSCKIKGKKLQEVATLYSLQKFFWGGGDDPSQLFARALQGPDERGGFVRHFSYDERGNVIEESLSGNLSGHCPVSLVLDIDGKVVSPGIEKYSKRYRYSEDGFNLLLREEEDSGLVIFYTYKPSTNRMTSKLICDREQILHRFFYEYNEDNILVREIEDDGSSTTSQDLSSVTFRKLKIFHPKLEQPALNLPEMIEEKYLDLSTGEEKLLKKSRLYYSPRSEVIQEDVFDAQGELKFSIFTSYDDRGRIIRKSNPIGQESVFQYDALGRCLFSKEAGSSIEKRMSYNASGQLLCQEEKSPEGTRTSFCRYDKRGFKIEETDFQGNTIRFIYDAFGRCVEEIFPTAFDKEGKAYSPVIKRSYDFLGNATSIAFPNGEVTSTQYNIFHKPSEIIYSDGAKVQHFYSGNNLLIKTIEADGSIIRYFYTVLGKLWKKQIFSPDEKLLSEELWEYKGELLFSHRDSAGIATFFRYDGAARKIEERRGEKKTLYSYDNLGNLAQTITKSTQEVFPFLIRTKKYDLLGRAIESKEKDNAGVLLSFVCYAYDLAGNCFRVIRKTSSGDAEDLFFYDSYRRLIRQVNPKGHESFITYNDHFKNELGEEVLQKTTQDPKGNFEIETFDVLGHLVSIEKKNPWKATVFREEFFYDGIGNKCRQKSSIFVLDKLSSTTFCRWEFGPRKKLLKLIEAENLPEQKITRYAYDSKGRQVSITKSDGTLLSYSYDFLDRLVSLVSSDNSINYSYTYDSLGHLIEVKDLICNVSTKRGYDALGRITSETLQNQLTIQKSYDPFDRCIVLSLFDGSSLHYHYDASHLLSLQKVLANHSIAYTHRYVRYGLSNELLEEELIGDLGKVHHSSNLLRQEKEITSSFESHHIDEFDPLGLVVKTHSTLTGDSSFTYDDLSQLEKESGAFSSHYLFNSHNSLLERDEKSLSVNALHQLLSSPEGAYTYDANGNPILKEAHNKKVRYRYDALDRLVEVSEEGIFSLHFTYDAFHRRLSKTLYLFSEGKQKEYAHLNFFYGGDNEIGACDCEGKILEFRALGIGKGAEIGAAIAMELDGEVFCPLYDLRGNTSALISLSTHKAVEFYRYDAFGRERIFDGQGKPLSESSLNNPWRFSSKRIDEESGLIYFGRRFYDPKEGRWLTPDPSGFTDGPNLYAFLLNSPLNRFDPMGLSSEFHADLYMAKRNAELQEEMSKTMLILRALATPFRLFGKVVEWVGENLLLPIPVLRDGIRYAGRFLQLNFEPIPKSDPYIHPVERKGENTPKGKILFINGVKNTEEDAEESGELIHQIAGDHVEVVTEYLPSRGLAHDFLECGLLKLGHPTPNSRLCRDLIRKECESLSPDAKLCVIVHSKGALALARALSTMSTLERDRLMIHTIAPGQVIPRNFGNVVTNTFSQRDPIIFANILGLMKNCLFGGSTVEFVPGKGALPFTDHAFASESYQKVLRDHVKEYLEEMGIKK